MRVHHYQADHENGPDHNGKYRCFCGMPEGNAVHLVPERPDDEKRAEARKVGERA